MTEEIEIANLVTRITLDDTHIEQTLAQLNRQMSVVTTEFRAASAKLGDVTNSEVALKQKSEALTQQLQIQQRRIVLLNDKFSEMVSTKGKDARETQKLEVQLNRAVTTYNRMHHELQRTSDQLQKQTSVLHRLGNALDVTSKKAAHIGRKMTDVGQSLSLFVTAPLLAVGTAATKTSIEFDSAFAGVKKTVDGTEKELAEIEKRIMEMSKNIPVTATAIAKVVETAGQLGVAKDSIMSFTRTVTDLGVATNLTSEDAATSFARMANITQMPQSQFDRLGATVVSLGNNLATTERDIVNMSLRLAGAGHQIGLSEAQVLSFSGALSSVGIEAEAGGSAFSKVMADMAQAVHNGGDKLEHFSLVAGMSSSQFKDAFQQDAAGALVAFIEGLGRMSKAGENTFHMLEMLNLSETRVRDTLLRASGAGDLFRTSLELGSRAWAENTALTKEANERYGTTDSKLKVLENRVSAASKTLGDAFAPALIGCMNVLEPALETLQTCAEEFASLDTAAQKNILVWTSVAVALGPVLIILGQLAVAISRLIIAIRALGAAMMWLMTHPVGRVITGIAALGMLWLNYRSNIKEAEKATRELGEAQQKLQKIQQKGIGRNEVDETEKKMEKLKKLIDTYQLFIATAEKMKRTRATRSLFEAERKLGVDFEDLQKQAKKFGVELRYLGENGKIAAGSLKDLQRVMTIYKTAVTDAKRATVQELHTQAEAIAKRKQEINSIQTLLKTYQSAKRGTVDWNHAQKELVRLYPQLSTATGVHAKAVEGLLLIKKQEVAQEWKSIQAKAQEALMVKQAAIAKQQAAISIATSITKITSASGMAQSALQKMNDELTRLRGEAASLQALTNIKVEDIQVPTVAAVAAPKVPGLPAKEKTERTGKQEKKTTAYENQALDAAYRRLEHKKHLDQLTRDHEVQMLEAIKAKHIQTASERMDIEERIYDAKKARGDHVLEKALKDYEREKTLRKLSENDEIVRLQRIQKKYADSVEDRERIDAMMIDAKQRKLEAEKQRHKQAIDYTKQQLQLAYEDKVAREKLSAEESFRLQDKLLNDQIWLNKNYVEKVRADARYTAEEKKDIERQVTTEIRRQINERLVLRRRYTEEIQNLQEQQKKQWIEDTNKLSQGLQAALREKYQAEKKAEEDRIRQSIAAHEKWKKNQLDTVKSLYDERMKQAERASKVEIQSIERVMNAQIEAIQAQLHALERTEKQTTREELDAEDQKKIDRLQTQMEYEHDHFNRLQLQKECNQIVQAREKRHQAEILSDRKEALKEEENTLREQLKEKTGLLKTQLAEKKQLLQADREAEINRINQIAEAQQAHFTHMLNETHVHYNQLLAAKNIQAEAEKMIVQNQQEEIIHLLHHFGEAYNLAGQTLGEQMYQGFKEQVSQIQSLIDDIQAQISGARHAAISALREVSTSGRTYGEDSRTSSSKRTISVTHNHYAPVTSPSEISRASTRAAQRLAFQV